MAYFEPYIDAEGAHIPTYQDTMDHLIDGYKQIFGEDVYMEPDSPDYMLLSVFARCLDDFASMAVDNYNARSITYATGDALDLLLPLVAMKRQSATASIVTLNLTGDAGTVIPAGSLVIDNAEYLWATVADVTLDANGTGSVTAACETKGTIKATPGSITRIYTPIIGWLGVNNQYAATPGKDIESDASVKARHAYVVGARASTTAGAILGALIAIENVRGAAVYENNTDETDDKGIPSHSLACVIYGGNVDAIARTIYEKKAPGIGLYGDVVRDVIDDYGQSHSIRFLRPGTVLPNFMVRITKLDGFDSELVEQAIRGAIFDAISGKGIGESLIISQLYGPCYSARPDLASTFIITQIQASVGVIPGDGYVTTTIVEAGWNERIVLTNQESSVQFTYND